MKNLIKQVNTLFEYYERDRKILTEIREEEAYNRGKQEAVSEFINHPIDITIEEELPDIVSIRAVSNNTNIDTKTLVTRHAITKEYVSYIVDELSSKLGRKLFSKGIYNELIKKVSDDYI